MFPIKIIRTLVILLTLVLCLVGDPASIKADDYTVYRFEETEVQRMDIILNWLEQTINRPSEPNLRLLETMVDMSEAESLRKQVLEISGLLEKAGVSCGVSLQPGTSSKKGNQTLVTAAFTAIAPSSVIADTLEFEFVTKGNKKAADRTVVELGGLEATLSQLAASLGTHLQSSDASYKGPDPLDCHPVDLGDSTAYQLLEQIGLHPDMSILTSGSRQDAWEGQLFGQPMGLIAQEYRLHMDDPSSILRDYDYLISSDCHWDRVVAAQPNANFGDDNLQVLKAFGSNGSGSMQFRHPAGLAWAQEMFYVADAYNDRVQVYSFSPLYIPPQVSYFRTISDNFDTPIDVAAGEIECWGELKPHIAILDQGNNRVYVEFFNPYTGQWNNHSFPSGATTFTLDHPTAICMGRHPVDHSPLDMIYVADNGNKRVISFYSQVCAAKPVTVFETSPGIFPDDAYLSSVDVDNYGFVYVVDQAYGTIYKFSLDLQEFIGKYPGGWSWLAGLRHPRSLKIAKSTRYNNGQADAFYNLGEAVITEDFNPSKGIRRFKLGNDVLAIDAFYIPRPFTWRAYDYLALRWHQTATMTANLSVDIQGPGSSLVEWGPWLQPAGERVVYWALPRDAPTDTTYGFELELRDPYDPSNVQFHGGSIFVERSVWHPGSQPCEIAYNSSRPDSLLDTCIIAGVHYIATIDVENTWTGTPAPGPYLWRNMTWGNEDQYVCTTTMFIQPDSFVASYELATQEPWVEFVVRDMNGRSPDEIHPWMSVVTSLGCDSTSGSGSKFTEPICGDNRFWFRVYDHIENSPCSTGTGGGGGCPFLYKWNGRGYDFVNNLLPQSESRSDNRIDVADQYPIYHPTVADSFYYKFMVTEEENEVSKLDALEILAFDVPRQLGRLKITNQDVPVYIIDSLSPIAATTEGGADVLGLLRNRDELRYETQEPGWIEFTYDLTGLDPDIVSSPNKKYPDPIGIDPDPDPKLNPKSADGSSRARSPSIYTVSYQGAKGDWQILDKIHPRVRCEGKFVETPYEREQKELKIRLAWNETTRLDNMDLYITKREAVAPVKLALVEATHSREGPITRRLTANDEFKQLLLPGDSIFLTYYAREYPKSGRRVFMFSAEGQYERYDGSKSYTLELPTDFVFEQNYPNPFNPVTTFEFSLPAPTHVTIEVFNVLGQRVATISDQDYPAGRHSIDWNSRTYGGAEVSSGVYFARFKAGDHEATRKMMVVK